MNSKVMVGRDNINHGKCKYLSILEEGLKMGGYFPIPTIIVRARIVPENFSLLKSSYIACGGKCQQCQ